MTKIKARPLSRWKNPVLQGDGMALSLGCQPIGLKSCLLEARASRPNILEITMKLSIPALAALAAFAFTSGAYAGVGEDIMLAQKCNKCHTEKTTKKGPSHASVAAKYKGNPEAAEKLFKALKAGGKMGDEEDHKQLKVSDEEIRAVVAAVLATK
jgi:cytochrome c